MTKKRRMPVNVLEERPQAEADGTFIDGILQGPGVATLDAAAEPPRGGETDEGGGAGSGASADATSPSPPRATSAQTRDWAEARRLRRAEGLVRSRSLFSAAVGLVPLSLLALVVLAGFQAEMTRALAREYDVPYRGVLVRSLIATVFVGAWAIWLATVAVAVLDVLPLPRLAIEILCLGLSAAASSYVVGKVFIKHFEAGGTLLDLNPTAMNEHFRRKHSQRSDSDRPNV